MASVKFYLDTRRAKNDGKFPLKLKVSANSKEGFLINLKIPLGENQWKNNEIVNHDNRKALNSYIKKRFSDVSEALYRLEFSGDLYRLDAAQIKKRLESAQGVGRQEAYTINCHFRSFISTRNRDTTKEIYDQTLIKMETFGGSGIAFSDINLAWLKSFEIFLKEQGLSVNSINLHIRNIRAVFNDAINEDRIEQNIYPFRKFKLKKESTAKRSLTAEQLRRICGWPCEAHERQYIDMFMLIFYLRGINIIDLVNLKEIVNGRVEYRRAKTGRLYSIKVEPEAQEIIEKYRGVNYLLDIRDRYDNYRNYTHRMNKNLKEFGTVSVGKKGKKIKEGAFPYLSTYYARHTWATIAAQLEIPKETIAASLGHGGTTVTDIYIDFDQNKVDAANRKVIDYISGIQLQK